MSDYATVGQVRALSSADKKEVAKSLFKTGAHLRNSPSFFDKRKKELYAMCDQLGDPHVFATNSHADTYCPYVARFVMAWAGVPLGSPSDPFVPGLNKHQRYQRRQALVVKHPHVVAYFFHLKTTAYIEHVCVGIMGANAWWSRYEWQSRGSTHAHYFLWFYNAPSISFLDDWLQQAMSEQMAEGGGCCELSDAELELVVDKLNFRALNVSADSANKQDREAAFAANFWSTRCSRWNFAWLDHLNAPDAVGEHHPSSQEHVRCEPSIDDLAADHGVSGGANQWLGRLLNATNRHTTHTDYCLRKDKHNQQYCRFRFPQEPREENDHVHFFCERIDRGVRWRLYFPINDPTRNSVNHWQALAQRGNCDFQVLIDHYSALEYMTKYASKAEKGSASFDTVLATVLQRSTEQLPDDASSQRAYSAVLSQVVGGRNWSAQEVGHVNLGCPTIVSSHVFETIYLAGSRKMLRKDILPSTGNNEPAFQPNSLEKYFNRLKSCTSSRGTLDDDQTTLLAHGFAGRLDPHAIDLEHVGGCSFTEFWRTYRLTSDGPEKNTYKVCMLVSH